MGFFTIQAFIYKSFEVINEEMTIFPKLFLLKNPNKPYYEFIQKEVIRWIDGASR